MTIPHITPEQASHAFTGAVVPLELLKIYNERTDKANAEQSAQPEPVDPHATLRAEYAKQVEEGTTGFYLWETLGKDGVTWHSINNCLGEFHSVCKYRYTDISCYVAKQGEPAKRMLRKDAQELQRSLGDTVDWVLNGHVKPSLGGFDFGASGTYTYAPKATINLDGKMVTPEQAKAEWDAKKETHDLFSCLGVSGWHESKNPQWYANAEYELRPKALKQVKWSDIPVGVMLTVGTLIGKNIEGSFIYLAKDEVSVRYIHPPCLPTLAPASEQPWIAINGKFNKVEGLIYDTKADAGCGTPDRDIACFRITGIAKGYVLEGAV